MSLMRSARRSRGLSAWGLTAAVLVGCSGHQTDELLASARGRIERADVEGARLELKTLLQSQPQSAEGRFLLGKVLHDTGDQASAEAELRRALELGFSETRVLPLLSSAMLGLGQGALLVKQFGLTRLPDAIADAELRTHVAAAEAADGHLDEADGQIAQALAEAPEFSKALLLRAKLTQARGDEAKALAQVQAVIDRRADSHEAWQLKGELLLRAHARGAAAERGPALAALLESTRLQPDNVAAHVEVIGLHLLHGDVAAANAQWVALHKAAPRHAETLFHEAVLAGHKGDFKRVRELCQQLLRAKPDDPRVLLLAGQAELNLGALAQAEAHFSKVAQLAPKAAMPRRWLARVQVQAGQTGKALALLRPLADGQPPDPQALLQIAEIQLLGGDHRGAEGTYARLAKLKPTDPRARTGLALARLQQGEQVDQAFVELRAVAGADPGTVADLALVSARLGRHDLAGALQAIDALGVKMPGQPLPDHLRGRVALQRRDRDGARQAFEAALAKDADYLPALAGLAMLDLAAAKPAAAKARLEALLVRQPQHTGAMMALAEISARSTNQLDEAVRWLDKAIKSDPSNPVPRLVLIDQLMGARQLKPALVAAQAAVAALPEQGDLLDRLGRLQLMAGDHQQALSSFNKLASLRPKSALPQLRAADAHASAGNLPAMAAAVRRATELEPHSLQVQQAQATLALRQGKPEHALAVARTLQTRYPDDAVGYRLESDVEMRRQRYDAAASALRKAVSRRQAGDSALRLHTALMLAGKTSEAEQLATDHRKRHPDDLSLDLQLADMVMAGGDLAGAEERYRALLARQPGNVVTLNNLAYVMARQQRPGGVAVAEKALALAPGTPALMDTLALCLAAEQQLPRAISVQTQAVATAPDMPQFRLRLARLHLQAGDKASARSELDRLASLGSAFNRQAEVVELLRGL